MEIKCVLVTYHKGDDSPDNGGNRHHQNVGKLLQF